MMTVVSQMQNHVVSWDTLSSPRPRLSDHSHSPHQRNSPFLTERHPRFINASKAILMKSGSVDLSNAIYLKASALIEALRQSVAGCASSLHDWDAQGERLVPTRMSDESEVEIVLGGVDRITSGRFVVVL